MNEELLKHLYSKYNLVSKGSLETFMSDMKNEETAKGFHSKYLSDKGDFNTFKTDLYTAPSNISQNTTPSTPTTQSSNSVAIDHGKVKNIIGTLESDNKYNAANKNTSARGRYQHMWSDHGSQIAQVTGIKDEATYLNTPEAQEKYQEYLQPMYEKQLPKLRKIAIEQGKDHSDEELMYLIHHSWTGNAEKFLKGQDVPDKEGLEKALAKSRERGLTTPRSVTNKLVQENTDFISVNGLLPTRAGKEFKSPIDKRMVDKLTGFMQDHGLVVTDTNDTKIHKSKEQKAGKSLDVNFDDKSINADKVKAAVLDGQKRGLKLVYEVKDKRVYDQFIKTRPDLKDHVAYIPAATGNHFSVYHADNYDPDANLLSSSKVIPQERLQEIKVIKSKIIGASRRAGKKEALQELKSAPKLSDVNTPFALLPGAIPIINAGKKLFSEEEQYRKAAAEMFATGQLNAKDFTNEELVEIYNAKAEIVDMEKQSKIAKKRVDDQLKDVGILEGVGDFFAGTPLDKLLGLGSADRLDTQDGKININYKEKNTERGFFSNNDKYLSPEEILNLKFHPEAKDPKNPNDPKNKSLRGIQKIIVSGDSLEFDAKTKADSLRKEFAGSRLQNLEKEITKVGGKDVLKTLRSLGQKAAEQTITEEETQQLNALQQKLENAGGLLSKYDEQITQYNTSNDAIKALQGKYGIVTKLRERDQEYQAQSDAYDKKLGFWGKKERSVTNVLSALGNNLLEMPGAIGNFAGIGVEAVTGLDLGASDAAKARTRAKVDYIASTDRKRGVLETTMNVDGYDVVFEGNKATAVYDSKGYKVEDSVAETVGVKAQEKLNTDYEGKQSNLNWLDNTSFNFGSLQQGVEDTAPQLVEIFLVGGAMRAGAAAATKTLATAATSGSRVANVARVLSKPLQSARGIESSALVPVFVKDMVDGAINDGAITPTQIFGTASVKLGMEALAESMFAGPMGKILAGRGISQTVFSKSLAEKLNDVVRHYATGKITSRDFMNHLGRATKELAKDAGGEFIEEAFIEWTNGAVNEFLNANLGTNYEEDSATAKEIMSAGLIGMGAGAMMSGPRVLASVADYKSSIQQSYQNLLSDVVGQTSASLVRGETVANPEAFKEYLTQAVADGQIDQKDADKYSGAIQSAANRTAFTNEIDVSKGVLKDLRDTRGLEARESFINLVRNTAFNKALTESIDDTNQYAKEEQSRKVEGYESVLKELELNAHKTIYSSATPTIIGLQRGLSLSQVSELRAKQASILDEVNATKLNAVNKAKAVELKLNEAANVILKSKENISEKEQAQIDAITEQINTLSEDLDETNTEEEAKAAVETDTATPEQVALQTKVQRDTVNNQFSNFVATDVNGISRIEDQTGFQGFVESNPLARDIIEQKLNELNITNYKLDNQNIKEDIATSPSTKKAGLEGRYAGKDPRIKTIEEAQFTADFIEELKLSRNNLDQTDPNYQQNLDVINSTIAEFEQLQTENDTEGSYERKYSNQAFRDFVDKRTSQKAEPVDYVKPEEVIDEDLSPEDFEFDDDPDAGTTDNAQKKAEVDKVLATLSDDLLFIMHATTPNNAKNIYESELTYKRGGAIDTTANIVSKNTLRDTLHAIIDGDARHRGYSDVFIAAVDRKTIEAIDAKSLGGKLQEYLEDNYLDKTARRLLPQELNLGYFTDGVLTIPAKTSTDIDVKVEATDKVIWGHPGLGKTTFRNKNPDLVLDFDTDYKPNIAKELGLPTDKQNSKGLNEWRTENNKVEFEQVMQKAWENAKKDAKSSGKILVVSDMMFLRQNLQDFNKVITTSEKTFLDRATARGDKASDLKPWKTNIDTLINTLPQDKVITTDKYFSDLFNLQSKPVEPIIGTTTSDGTIKVTANGYQALSITDNLIVSDYLQPGNSAFYELEGSTGTTGKPRIQMVVYYNPKTKKFGQPTTGSKRIVIGQGFGKDPNNLAERFAAEIAAGKERVETKVTYVNLNKSKFTLDNKEVLSIEDVEAMRPYMYVIGKSFSSNENIVLLNKESDGENFLSISDFISDLKAKFPNIKNFTKVEEELRRDINNGKVVFVKGDTIIPLDTITNREYEPNKKFIEKLVESLTLDATGTASWKIDVDGQMLSDAVQKRSTVKDYTNEKSPNFRGRLIEYFASGPQHRTENPEELLYKIEYNEEEAKSEKVYLTKEQALEELLNIRAQVNHEDLRASKAPKNLTTLLSDVLRVPAKTSPGFAGIYNVVGLESVGGTSTTPDVIQVQDEAIVTPEAKETKNNAPAEATPETPKTTKGRKGKTNKDFKISNVDYAGRVEKAVSYLKTRFEEIGVEVNDDILRNLVRNTANEGSKVWGAFHNAMVTLSSNASEKIGRHESIHVAEIMFHTDAQIKVFRQEALTRYGKELGISKTKVEDLTDKELTDIREALATEFEDYKNTLLLPEGFSKKYPTISKFINNLFNFLKKNYLIGRSYITNNKSIDQLFFEVENNILGRDFIGRRKKNVRDTFQKALDNLEKPDFKVSDWSTAETYKFADFISTDIFTRFLQSTYKRNNMSEVMAVNKQLSPALLFKQFKNNLKTTLDTYKQQIVDREGLDETSEDYEILDGLLEDIYNQYAGKTPNTAFAFIVNKRLENRFVKGGKYDDVTEEDLVAEQNENEKEVKDTSEENQLESWQTKQGKIDAKTKSSARLREFFSSFPLRTRLIKNGKSERTTITDMDLYNKLYYKGEYIHNKLLVELSDNSTYADFITAINNLVPKHQFAGDLLGSIMNLSEEQLMEAYDNGTLELPLDLLENQDNYPSYNMWILKDMYQAIADQTNLNPFKTLTTTKAKQVLTAKVVKSVKNTDFENAVRSLKETLDNKFADLDKKAALKDLLETTIAAIEAKGKVAGLITKVFSEIGYEASNELLLNLQPSTSLDGSEDNLSYLKRALTSILNDINDNKNVDPTGRIEFIAKLLSNYSTISSGLSYMNVENENEFAHKNSNYLTRVQAIWNKGQERRKEWVESMRMFNGQPILSHYRNPFYTDFLKESSDYRIVVDGFIQVEGQSNSGKAYADYNKAEIIASSINAFLAKDSGAVENDTIKKGGKHALYHTQVYSDSPQRWFLHAPVFTQKDITERLTELTYGEIERIFYTKQGSLSQFEKLKKAGSMFQNIPELNDVTFTNTTGNKLDFADIFNLEDWQDFSGTAIVPGLKTMTYTSKAGEKITVDVPSSNYKSLLEKVIDTVLQDNKNNFLEYLAKEEVYTMIVPVVTGTEDVTGKIKEKDLEEFYYNTFYNNIISQNVFGGDPANYKTNAGGYKTDIDIVKRTKQEISPNILKVFKRPTFNVIILKDIELETPYFQKKGKNVQANTTDGGAYHTLARRREIMEADPNWDLIKNDVAPIFDRIQDGTYTLEDLQTLDLQPLKPFVYTQMIQQINTKRPDGTPGTAAIRVSIQLKDSEHVLLPTEAFLVEGQERYIRPTSLADITNGKYVRPDLAKLLYLMETQGIDLAVFESGSKAEIFNKVDIDSADEAIITKSKVTLKNSDWGIQQEVPRKDMEAKVGQGSQEHKIMSANVDPNWSFKYDGKTYSGQQGANDLLQSIQERNAEANLKKALKKITDKNGNVDINKVLDILKEGIIEKNSNLEALEGLVRQADGKTLIPVELLGKKGQQVLNSILKKVSTFKVKGAALVNKPGFGYMGNRNNPNTFSDDLKLITEKDKDGDIRIKYWEAVVPVYDPVIYDYIDINGNLLLDAAGNPLIPEKLLQAFFYRIPTEDKYSMFPIRIKRFSMPSQGGGIILPREATETAGLDFDVDKLYGYYYNFKVKTTPVELDTFKKYALQEVEVDDKDIASKYIDAIYGGYIEDVEMLQEKGLSEDDIPFIKKYSVSLRKSEQQYKLDNPEATFTKEVDIYESSLNTAEGTQNLKLDAYFSLTGTKAYGRDALKPGNKDRLTALRDKALANASAPNYSYADPVHITNNATKNIVGKRLIGIFANATSFYNLIQGVTKINLKGKLTFVAGSTIYNFTSLADVNPQISKNIAELLFASTEDVKDPVLEPLNINEITSSLLVTMLSLTADNGDKIMKFEDAIAVLSEPSIVEAVRKVQKEGGRLKDVYKGQYEKLVNISDAYNNIISASKIDQELGPDFYTIQSKLASIDSIIEASTGRFYPLISNDVIKILPTSSLESNIKQLNTYRKALEKELDMFSDVYSFLQPTVQNILGDLGDISKNKKLRSSDMQKYSYMVYDAAIQGYLHSQDKLEDLKQNFPKRLAAYTFPEGSGILQQAFEVVNNVASMRWVNISASDILTQYQNGFTDLFTSDPEFASDLATYAFLTGTNFSMNSIVKIVPNVYYKTDEGKVIRNIINGNQLNSALSNLSDPFTAVLFNNFAPILNELKDFIFKDGVYTSNTPMEDEYVYIREKTGNILLKQTEEGDYYPVHRQVKGALPNYIVNTAVEINKSGTSVEDSFEEADDFAEDTAPDFDPDGTSDLGDPDNDTTLNDDNIKICL